MAGVRSAEFLDALRGTEERLSAQLEDVLKEQKAHVALLKELFGSSAGRQLGPSDGASFPPDEKTSEPTSEDDAKETCKAAIKFGSSEEKALAQHAEIKTATAEQGGVPSEGNSRFSAQGCMHADSCVQPADPAGGTPRVERLIRAATPAEITLNEMQMNTIVPGWPEAIKPRFELLDDAAIKKGKTSLISSGRSTIGRLGTISSILGVASQGGADHSQEGHQPTRQCSCLATCAVVRLCSVGDPTSMSHVFFSLFGAIMLLVDLTMSPFMLAWEVPIQGPLLYFGYLSSCYWTADIVVSLRTGFFREGNLILHGPTVARRYLKTWFLPDVTLVLCEWLGVILSTIHGASGASASLSMLRIVKLGKFVRIVVLIRAVRYLRILTELFDNVLSEVHRVILTFVALCCMAFWGTHVLACIWFVVGRAGPSDTGEHWVDFFEQRQPHLLAQYMFALQWAIATLTLGSSDVGSINTIERIFSTIVMVFGLLASSFLVSSLFAAIVDIRMGQKERLQKVRLLREYLRMHSVRASVAVAVLQQVSARLSQRAQLTESNVSALELLPSSLRLELRFEIVKQHLVKHGFFEFLLSVDKQWSVIYLGPAVGMVHLRPHDDIFFAGSPAGKAYCLAKGTATYIQEPDYAPVADRTEAAVEAGAWLAEGALWAEWIHVGQATAESPCSVLTVEPKQFQAGLQARPYVKQLVLDYASEFYKRLVASRPPSAPWPTDLAVHGTEWSDLVLFMPLDTQIEVSVQALGRLKFHGILGKLGRSLVLKKLENEILNGMSVIVHDELHGVARVVAVVALRIVRDDGRILVQLGKAKGESLEANCVLPGAKQQPAEPVSATLQRVLRTRLAPFADIVEVDQIERATAQSQSSGYGIRTKYIRSICHARIEGDVDIDVPVCSVGEPFIRRTCSRASSASSMVSNVVPHGFAGLGSSRPIHLASNFLDEHYDQPVFFIRGEEDDNGGFYTWLTPQMFEHLSKESSKPQIIAWLAQLGTPPMLEAGLGNRICDAEHVEHGVVGL